MNRAIVYGPRSLGGLGFRDIYTTQGANHVLKLIQTLCSPGQPRNLLRLLLVEWQIHSGSSYPLLQLPHLPCNNLEGSWLTTTRTFLSSIHGSITINNYYCPTSTHINDISLMDAFHRIPGIGQKRMIHLNLCRLYLQVHFLSELVTDDGQQLQPGFWTGTSSNRTHPPIHRYPRQQSPSPPIWAFWRAAIRKLFCHPRTIRLRQPIVLSTQPGIDDSTPHLPSPFDSNTLPQWQQSLQRHLQIHIPQHSLMSVVAESMSNTTLLVASDGGANTTQATFGWTL